MQEVWGSNPHSSTGQKRNSKSRAASTAAKYRNGYASNAAPPARVGAFLVQGCWQRQRIPRGKAKAAGPLSWRNVLSPGPMTLAANAMLGRQFQHGLLPSVQTVSGDLSSVGAWSWSVAVATWCRCATLRHWLEPVARARHRFAPGAGTLSSNCASCAPRRTSARSRRAAKALRAGRAGEARRPARPEVLVPWCRGAVDSRQRMAAQVAVLTSQAVIGDCGRPARGRPSRSGSWQPSGSNLPDYLK
jgi:hypothetical protein